MPVLFKTPKTKLYSRDFQQITNLLKGKSIEYWHKAYFYLNELTYKLIRMVHKAYHIHYVLILKDIE
jgi:hypothetical protein